MALAGKATGSYVVSSPNSADLGIKTLLGDYKEQEEKNHERKVYKKAQKIEGHEDVRVFMYYWDKRDGDEFSGWWFGDQVGGSQVWARCPVHALTPPKAGWCIPWDTTVSKNELVVTPAGATPAPSKPVLGSKPVVGTTATTGPAAVNASAAVAATAQVKKTTDAVVNAEKAAQKAIQMAKALCMNAKATEEDVDKVTTELETQQAALADVESTLTDDLAQLKSANQMGPLNMLSKLSPRLKFLTTTLTSELEKVKSHLARVAEQQQKMAEKEETDMEDFRSSLSEIEEAISAVEEAIEDAASLAEPLENDPPEDLDNEEFKMSGEEIEKAAVTAQEKLGEARTLINKKSLALKQYAPEARKTAMTQFGELQTKMNDLQKKVNPIKTFRRDFSARIAARKAMATLAEQVSNLEEEIERAEMMVESSGQMTEEEVSSAEAVIPAITKTLGQLNATIEQKMRMAQGVQREEFQKMKDKFNESRVKLATVQAILKKNKDSITAMKIAELVAEKLKEAEEEFEKCSTAEMPFLKGIEVLPAEESATAIKESETAISATQIALGQAQQFFRQKSMEMKSFAPDLAKAALEDLQPIEERMKELVEKLKHFAKETAERKVSAVLAEAVVAADETEAKVAELSEICSLFSVEKMEEATVDELKDAHEKSVTLQAESAEVLQKARVVLAGKQKSAMGNRDVNAGLQKLNQRLSASQQEMQKARTSAQTGEKLVQTKTFLADTTEALEKAEQNVEKAEEYSKDEGVADDLVLEMVTILNEASDSVTGLKKATDAQILRALPLMKPVLVQSQEKCKDLLAKCATIKTSTKAARERVLAELYKSEAEKNVSEVEELLQKVDEVELPFLKGIEALAPDETMRIVEASEKAAAEVQTAIAKARSYQASKTSELRSFAADAKTEALEEFKTLSEKLNTANQKLTVFRKDTEGRKKNALMQSTVEKVTNLESELKLTADAVEPLQLQAEAKAADMKLKLAKRFKKKDAEEVEEEILIPEVSEETANTAVETVRKAAALAEECRVQIQERSKEVRGDASLSETLKDMQERFAAAQKEIARVKKYTSEAEQRLQAKELVVEAAEKVDSVKEAIKLATASWADLLEDDSVALLLYCNVRAIASALTEHLAKKEMKLSEYITQTVGEGLDEKAFDAYLEALHKNIERNEVEFEEARRKLLFVHMDQDKDGKIGVDDFKKIFSERYTCMQNITITDGYDITDSKTLGRLQPKDVVTSISGVRTDTETGVSRVECRLEDGTPGWVSIKGTGGVVYLQLEQPITAFSAKAEKVMEQAVKSLTDVTTFFTQKIAALNQHRTGPLHEVKAEVNTKRQELTASRTALEELKKKTMIAKRDLIHKEAREAKAHIEREEKRAAAAFIEDGTNSVKKVEELAKEIETEASKFLDLSADERTSFASPLKIQTTTEKLLPSISEAVTAARTSLKEQQEKLPKTLKGAMAEAKRELAKLSVTVDAALKKSKKVVDDVKAACEKLVENRATELADRLRKEAQTKKITWEAIFEKYAGEAKTCIPEDGFTKLVTELEGFTMPEEHVKLLCKKLTTGQTEAGIDRREFAGFVQCYYKVVKGIAITDEFDATSAKTLRKIDVNELLELIEGPKTDAKSGMPRVYVRCLRDATVGWASVKGNQGTAFLETTEKPFYSTMKNLVLEKDFQEAEAVRPIASDEILEVLEGPKRVQLGPQMRLKVRATSDKTLGWITVTDSAGTKFAEADTKLYVCKATVAMTDNLDLADCTVVKKLGVGDLFTVADEQKPDPESNLKRVKGKCLSDNKEGWVTLQGNAGTVYAEPSVKHYTVVKEVAVHKSFKSSGSDDVRMLAVDESLEVMEGPKEETFTPVYRMKVKTVSDGVTGWLTRDNVAIRPWSIHYKCLIKTSLDEACETTDVTSIRDLAVGELFDIIEGPVEHKVTKDEEEHVILRAKGKALKDGAIGWATVRTAEGKRPLQAKA